MKHGYNHAEHQPITRDCSYAIFFCCVPVPKAHWEPQNREGKQSIHQSAVHAIQVALRPRTANGRVHLRPTGTSMKTVPVRYHYRAGCTSTSTRTTSSRLVMLLYLRDRWPWPWCLSDWPDYIRRCSSPRLMRRCRIWWRPHSSPPTCLMMLVCIQVHTGVVLLNGERLQQWLWLPTLGMDWRG